MFGLLAFAVATQARDGRILEEVVQNEVEVKPRLAPDSAPMPKSCEMIYEAICINKKFDNVASTVPAFSLGLPASQGDGRGCRGACTGIL